MSLTWLASLNLARKKLLLNVITIVQGWIVVLEWHIYHFLSHQWDKKVIQALSDIGDWLSYVHCMIGVLIFCHPNITVACDNNCSWLFFFTCTASPMSLLSLKNYFLADFSFLNDNCYLLCHQWDVIKLFKYFLILENDWIMSITKIGFHPFGHKNTVSCFNNCFR